MRVLLVEDEPALCELAGLWLELLGHEVVAVHSGQQARQWLDNQDFDVLFSDVVMPGGMDGVGLARQAVIDRPQMKVLLASGLGEQLRETHELPWTILSKPYRMAELGAALLALTKSGPA